jgi:hypothetical protein
MIACATADVVVRALLGDEVAFVVGHFSMPKGFPFDRTESELLVGFYARIGLIQALAGIEGLGYPVLEIKPEEDAKGRALLSAVNETTLNRYAEELLIPFYEEKTGLSGETLAERASSRRKGS